jgi:hypothetical protein
MAFVNIQNLSLTFGVSLLFDAINFTIEPGEKSNRKQSRLLKEVVPVDGVCKYTESQSDLWR